MGLAGLVEFFSLYETPHAVVVQHKGLGFFYWLLIVFVTIYVVGDVFYWHSYLEYETPVGAASISIHATDTESRHRNADSTGKVNLIPVPFLSYEFEDVHSNNGGNAVIITYREKRLQRRDCDPTTGTCNHKWIDVEKSAHYIEGIEDIETKIEHAMYCPEFYHQTNDPLYMMSGHNMTGSLKVLAPDAQLSNTHKHFKQHEKLRVPLRDLLAATGLSLDQLNSEGKSHRETGLMFVLTIAYWNRPDWSGVKPTVYDLTVHQLPGMRHKYKQVQELNSTHRYRSVDIGIEIKTQITGRIGKFSWAVFLGNVARGSSLIAAASFVVDALALYVLPLRTRFATAKYTTVLLDKHKHEHEHKE